MEEMCEKEREIHIVT